MKLSFLLVEKKSLFDRATRAIGFNDLFPKEILTDIAENELVEYFILLKTIVNGGTIDFMDKILYFDSVNFCRAEE